MPDSPSTPTSGRPHHRLPREERPAGQHRRLLLRGQRRLRRGSPNGSVNENKFFNSYPDELSENLKYWTSSADPIPTATIPTGWAVATLDPFQMFKRYSEYAGGTC